MKCICGSSKLKAYNFDNLDYIYYYVKNSWVLENPLLGYFHSTKNQFRIQCIKCQHSWREDNISPQKSPAINHNEIVLDLDHTLFHVEYDFELNSFDFSFKDPQSPRMYYAKKRPYLDEFIKALELRFEKINFYTAAVDWYADKLVASLNINTSKLGFIKTRKDTFTARPLSFDLEHIKSLNNSLVVEDKPLVVEGYNNVIFKVSPYYVGLPDKELLKIIKQLRKKESKIIAPKKISGEVILFLKNIKIKFKKSPEKLIKEIISISSTTQEELDTFSVRTSFFKSYSQTIENYTTISFVDLSYINYKAVYDLLKKYSKHKLISQRKYDEILNKRAKKFSSNF